MLNKSRAVAAVASRVITQEMERADVWRFLARAQSQSDRAIQNLSKRLLQLIAVWVISFGAALHMVKGGSIAGLALANLSPLLLVGPVLGASLFHIAGNSLVASDVYQAIASRCYAVLFPQLQREDVEALEVEPDFLEIDVYMLPHRTGLLGRLLNASTIFLIALVIVGPVVLIGHMCYLAFMPGVPTTLSITSGLIALFLVARALLVVRASFNPATEAAIVGPTES